MVGIAGQVRDGDTLQLLQTRTPEPGKLEGQLFRSQGGVFRSLGAWIEGWYRLASEQSPYADGKDPLLGVEQVAQAFQS